MMSYSSDDLEKKLSTELETLHVKVEDMSDGCGMKFNCVVVSAKFDGKRLLERHRMVNGALEEELKSIHALSMKTYTPEQWEKQKSS